MHFSAIGLNQQTLYVHQIVSLVYDCYSFPIWAKLSDAWPLWMNVSQIHNVYCKSLCNSESSPIAIFLQKKQKIILTRHACHNVICSRVKIAPTLSSNVQVKIWLRKNIDLFKVFYLSNAMSDWLDRGEHARIGINFLFENGRGLNRAAVESF